MWSILLIGLILLATQPAFSAELRGRVIKVHDADTVTVKAKTGTFQIRLAAIDAPELKQDYGLEAQIYLSKLLLKKRVLVYVFGNDKYGRFIGEVTYRKKDVNQQVVRTGNAWYYAQYGKNLHYQAAEDEARNEKLGLWAKPDPIPPWDFRKNQKESK